MIIFRYLSKEIFVTLFATTLILMVLFITNQSLQFLDRAANGEIPATVLLQLILLQIPLLLGFLIPLGLYLGLLLTIARWSLSSEMTVLYACGFSRIKLIGYVLVIACAVSFVVALLMAVVVPKAQGKISDIIAHSELNASIEKVIPGRFMSIGKNNDIVFYAKNVVSHSIMQSVFFAKKETTNPKTKNTREKWGIIVASSAHEAYLPKQKGEYIIFNNGYRYDGIPGQKAFDIMKFKTYGFRLNTTAVNSSNNVKYFSMQHLWQDYHRNTNAAIELQWRLAMPISVFIFALLAVPLGEIKPRFGKLTQLFPAMFIYLIYADLLFLSRSWIQTGKLSIAWGMWWVHLLPLFLAVILILYRIGFKRIRFMFDRVMR